MGATTDFIILGVASADAVNSLNQGMDPVGWSGTTISVASNAGSLATSSIEQIGVAAPSVSTVTSITKSLSGLGAVGAGLTAIQIKIDLSAGKDIKVGDVITVGTAIPIGLAVAVGAISTGSILVPIAAITGVAAGISNLYGFTLTDIFKKLDEFVKDRELTSAEQNVVEDFVAQHSTTFKTLNSSTEVLIDQKSGVNFTSAQSFIPPRRDPLVFDLDGDGLETAGPAQSGVLFDHDADGIKTGTGWVKSDDGFLVMDRNGNGVIDNGRELFGDATPLYAGGTAADGFAALAQEDSNSDGKITSADSKWSSLRIWRDLNQDGVSQANELFTMQNASIAGINVAKTANSVTLANGN